MKRILALMLALVVTLGLAGCVFDGLSMPETKPRETQKPTSGVLRIATSPDFAPMEFVDPTKSGQDQFVGFDMTLARYIADELNMELEIMPMDFKSCQMAVYAGTVDMAISGFSWTEERAEEYNVSDYYHAVGNTDRQILITLRSGGESYPDEQSLSGARIGVQSGSLQETLTADQLPDSQCVPFSDLDTAVHQLLNGDFDCLAVADGNGDAIIANHPEIMKTGFEFVVEPKYTGNVILLQKGNDELTETVNQLLSQASVHFEQWYAEARSTAGIQVVYDPNGNVLGEAE